VSNTLSTRIFHWLAVGIAILSPLFTYALTAVDSYVKTSDETITSSTTLQDDNELVKTLEANKRYFFESRILFTAHATPDIKLTFSFTGTSAVANWQTCDVATPVSFGTGTLITGSGVLKEISLCGVIETTSSGVLSFQWAQNTSDVNNTTVNENSTLIVYDVSTNGDLSTGSASSTVDLTDTNNIMLFSSGSLLFLISFYVISKILR